MISCTFSIAGSSLRTRLLSLANNLPGSAICARQAGTSCHVRSLDRIGINKLSIECRCYSAVTFRIGIGIEGAVQLPFAETDEADSEWLDHRFRLYNRYVRLLGGSDTDIVNSRNHYNIAVRRVLLASHREADAPAASVFLTVVITCPLTNKQCRRSGFRKDSYRCSAPSAAGRADYKRECQCMCVSHRFAPPDVRR
jgi:hypothetical protein